MPISPSEQTRVGPDDCRETVFRVPSSHDAVESLIDRIGHLIRDLPLSESARYYLQFVVHEALTNAVVHGNGTDPCKAVTVTCRFEASQVTVVVSDEGNGFDPAGVPDPTTEANILRESGRGVYLMRAYADECRFEDGGRRVVLVKRYDLPHDGPLDFD